MIFGVVVCISLIVSVFLDMVIFNMNFFKLDKDQRGIINIEYNDLNLHDMKKEEGKLIVTGDDPYFSIKRNMYISFLRIGLSNKSSEVDISYRSKKVAVIDKKKYIRNKNINDDIYMKVNENSNDIIFNIKVNDNVKELSIDNISVDNSYTVNYLRILSVFIILVLVSFMIINAKLISEKLHISFLVIALSIGSLMVILMPPFYGMDEREHFIKAYETASGEFRFGEVKPVNWTTNIDEFFIYRDGPVTFNSYKERKEFMKKMYNKDYSHPGIFRTCSEPYLSVGYIPASIGIFIGKNFKLPLMATFYLGRMVSMIMYSIIGTLCIKYAKVAKKTVFCVLLLTVSLLSSSVYSADSMAIIFSVLSVVSFINMLSDEDGRVTLKDIFIFIFSVSIATMSKIAYALLCILILCVPTKKFMESNKKKVYMYKMMVLLICGLACLGTLRFAMDKPINQWGIPGVDDVVQKSFIFHHPIKYLEIVIKNVMTSFGGYFIESSSSLFYAQKLPEFFSILITVTLFIIAFIDNEEDKLTLTIWEKATMLLSIILCLGMVITAIYISFNAALSNNIIGVQSRYFIPLMLPFLLLFKNNSIRHNFKDKHVNYVISWIFAGTLITASIQLLLQFNV